MRKDVLLIAHFCGDFDGNANNRFNFIADLLSANKFEVELVTTDFSHFLKVRRCAISKLFNYQITMIHEPGYIENVSLKRFYSHYVMGKNLMKYLKARKKPDVIYCGFPSLDVAKVAATYARKNNIRFIIDIQDLWPEAFKMVFPISILRDFLFYPMKRKSNYVYATADEIIAVSKSYADRALKVNKKCKRAHAIYIGTELRHFNKLALENKFNTKPKNEIWLAYLGTLGHSYDLTCVFDSLKILKDKGINNIKFMVMGDGPLGSMFKEYAEERGLYCEFTGWLDYGKMVGILTACDIAVNPIARGSFASIINKHADYAAAGLPVLNTQESQEYRDLLTKYNAGFNCETNNPLDLAKKLLTLYEDEKLRKIMGGNSLKLAKEKFDRQLIYNEIVDVILR